MQCSSREVILLRDVLIAVIVVPANCNKWELLDSERFNWYNALSIDLFGARNTRVIGTSSL